MVDAFWNAIPRHAFQGGIYMLEGFSCNIGVSAGEDGISVVDDAYASLADFGLEWRGNLIKKAPMLLAMIYADLSRAHP